MVVLKKKKHGRREIKGVVFLFFLGLFGVGGCQPQGVAEPILKAPLESAARVESSFKESDPLKKKHTAEVSNLADVPSEYSVSSVPFQPGRALTVFESANFIGSGRCAVCHEKLIDSRGNDMSIVTHWRSTMMANGAVDPLWQAKVASEIARNPHLKQVLEEKCATCHMPMAITQAAAQGMEKAIFAGGFSSPSSQLHGAAMDGVSCALCHQIQDDKLGEKERFSGKYPIDTNQSGINRKIFGPYQETFQKTMQTSVGFTPVYGPQMNDSALCATCHTLFTPFVDKEGRVVGEFPEQTPYLEWQHSDFGVSDGKRYDIGENPGSGMSCQECHMPHSPAGNVKIANWAPPEITEKGHFSQHHFVGGNVFMLNMLQNNVADLQLTTSTAALEATKERTIGQLQTRTAGLAIAGLSLENEALTALVRVENKSGHKFPTGIPIRAAWIHLVVTDGLGELVFESGRPQADGTIVGNDNDRDGLAYEKHHREINDPEQVQVYEAIMHDTDNQVTSTLLRAASYVKDNRLLPKGFDKQTAQKDIGVFGEAAVDTSFGGGADLVTYKVPIAGHRAPFTVQTELLYRAVAPAFVADLARDRDLPEVRRFMRYYKKAEKRPVAVAAAQATIR